MLWDWYNDRLYRERIESKLNYIIALLTQINAADAAKHLEMQLKEPKSE